MQIKKKKKARAKLLSCTMISELPVSPTLLASPSYWQYIKVQRKENPQFSMDSITKGIWDIFMKQYGDCFEWGFLVCLLFS